VDPLNESSSRGDDTETNPDERIGTIIDARYKVLEAMASGSMGAVYKAERVPVGKLVAVKFLHSSYAKDSEFLARFERETRVMSKLAHPNCVSVVDFGVWEGAPYLVMEYVAGTTLRTLLDEGPLAPERALKLAKQIAAGLAHAHAQGVVHRDVKPANIMISQELGTGDHVRILDFGLARLRGNIGRDATQANVVVGTPNYMAPEQTIGGGTIDARTDIYAVGVVLFEMVAGQRPFFAEDTMQLLGMHRGAPVPRLADKMLVPVPVPEGLQDLIEQAMAKSPDDRFQTAIELTEAIDALALAQSRPTKVDPAAIASTLLDVRSGKHARTTEPERPVHKKSGGAGGLGFLVVLLAGAAVAVWYVKMRPKAGSETQPGDAPAMVATNPPPMSDAATPDAEPMIVAPPVPVIDAPELDAPPVDAPEIDATIAIDAAAIATAEIDAGAVTVPGAGSGSGSGSDEIEMDPGVATNPDPNADKQTAEDEAEDAPETTEDAEKRAPAAPVLATTVAAAVQQIKDGKRDLALSSLNALWKKSPKSSYIPFLLGNLYFDKLWWAVAMDHYKAAISKNGGYRSNAVLNRNVIKMLGSPRTVKKATGFIRTTIGKPAIPYLKQAAKSEPNDRVRKTAASLAKTVR
jgi:serine/threonine protein kinase